MYIYIYACSSTIFRIHIYIYIYISVWENTNSHIQGSMIEMIYKETKK